jgi:PAS domain S-box-containing protein
VDTPAVPGARALTSVPLTLNRPAAYAFALGITAVAVLLRWAIDPILQDQLSLVTLFGAVTLIVWVAGLRPAVVAAFLGYLACEYYFVQRHRPAFTYTAADAVGFVAYLVSIGAIIVFGEGMRRARRGERGRADLLQAIFGSIADAIITIDTGGRITFLNTIAESLVGSNLREVSGQPLDSVVHLRPGAHTPTDESLGLQAIREGRSVVSPHLWTLVARNERQHVVECSASPIREADGRISGAVLIIRDATPRRDLERERERTTRALSASEERLRLAQQVAGIGTFELNIVTGVNTWTPELEAIHGLPPGGFQGSQQHWEQLVHPDDLEPARERVRQALASRTVAGGEWRIVRPDGQMRWIAGQAVLLPDDAGQPTRFLGVNIDITDRKRAEQATARLAAIVESSDDAILSKDLTGRILSWNKGAERLFGYREDEIVGQSVEILIPPSRLEEEPGILARIARGQRVDHYETVRRRKDGTLVEISLTVSPLFDSSGTVIGASKIARDISERRQAEQALKDADRRKDEFLATLAHELRNPLAPIRNGVGILRAVHRQPVEFERVLTVMDRQLSQMVRLIDDLMDVSRITLGRFHLRFERVDLATVMQTAIDACRPLADRAAHTLTLVLPPAPVTLLADPVRLAQVFSNLLSNGGRIQFEATAHRDGVIVRVRDNGLGLSPDEIPGIFEMFSQVDKTLERSQAGLGLGLSIAKRLAELHGGTLAATSSGPGLGSEFAVHLPLPSSDPLPASDVEANDSTPPAITSDLPAMRILVVDDSLDSAESLSMLLTLHGHQTFTAHDGIEAVAQAESSRPDVILLDIGLPRMNGYDACRQIREQSWGKEITVIALTGWGQDEDKRLAREAGFDGHLVKPIEHGTLMTLLGSLPRQRA